jgi:hypothetical protein
VAEIKRAAREDPRHGAEGAVLFLEKVAPALDQVDGSSGAMGTAVRLAAIHCLTEGYGFDHGQRGRITARCDFAPGRALGPEDRSVPVPPPGMLSTHLASRRAFQALPAGWILVADAEGFAELYK